MKAAALILLLCSAPIATAQMPCERIGVNVIERLAPNIPGAAIASFGGCVREHRVCMIAEGGEVIHAEAVKELSYETVWGGIVQSPSSEQSPVCLLGSYSGGSAAAWLFDGWSISDSNGVGHMNLEKAGLNSDAVSARGLGNEIYKAYAQSAK